jgi:hypothetical protein
VRRIHSAGPNVRLELTAESGEHLLVEVPQEHFRSRQITTGSQVFVSPRDVKVFTQEETGNGDPEPAQQPASHGALEVPLGANAPTRRSSVGQSSRRKANAPAVPGPDGPPGPRGAVFGTEFGHPC